jgi:hypothetical protein
MKYSKRDMMVMKVEELAASLKAKNYDVKIIKSGEYRAVEITGMMSESSLSCDGEGNGLSGNNPEIIPENDDR